MLLTPPHIIIVVQLNGFISGSLLQQRPLYKPPTFHLDRYRTIYIGLYGAYLPAYVRVIFMNMYSL